LLADGVAFVTEFKGCLFSSGKMFRKDLYLKIIIGLQWLKRR
jgi:hypothetical protein